MEKISVKTNSSKYFMTLAASPENESRGYMGFMPLPSAKVKDEFKGNNWVRIGRWMLTLLEYIWLFNIGIGLINLFPIFITDGARMLLAIVQQKFKNAKKAMQVYMFINKAFLIMILILIFAPALKKAFGAIIGIF